MTDKLVKTDGTSAGLTLGSAISDTDAFEVQQAFVAPASTLHQTFAAIKTWVKAWIAKGDVGLGNVDNTSDANKPVSTAQAAADALALLKTDNLASLSDAPAARNNLGGYAYCDPDYNDTGVYLTTPSSSYATGAMTALRLSMIPIWVPRTRTFTTYAVVVTALQGTAGIRVGLYNSNSSLQPTTKIDEGATQIDASTGTGATGVKTVAFTVNQSLKPGLYFLACLSDGTPTISRLPNATTPSMGAKFVAAGVSANGAKYRDTVTYTTLPADETAQTYTSQAGGGQNLYIVGIR